MYFRIAIHPMNVEKNGTNWTLSTFSQKLRALQFAIVHGSWISLKTTTNTTSYASQKRTSEGDWIWLVFNLNIWNWIWFVKCSCLRFVIFVLKIKKKSFQISFTTSETLCRLQTLLRFCWRSIHSAVFGKSTANRTTPAFAIRRQSKQLFEFRWTNNGFGSINQTNQISRSNSQFKFTVRGLCIFFRKLYFSLIFLTILGLW